MMNKRRGRPVGCVFQSSLQQKAKLVISDVGITPTELACVLGTSRGYARLIINRLVDKGQARWSGPRQSGRAYFEERKAFVINSFSLGV